MSGVTVRVGLLLAPYAFIVFGLRARRRVWRAAAIDAATVWGVLAVLITELHSLAGMGRRSSAPPFHKVSWRHREPKTTMWSRFCCWSWLVTSFPSNANQR